MALEGGGLLYLGRGKQMYTCRSQAGQIPQGGQMAKVKGQVRGDNGLLDDGEAGRVLLRGQVLQDPVQVFMSLNIKPKCSCG